MAEALGLASGVIAVVEMAAKVGGASIKLKRLWNEINEVPSVLLQKAELVQSMDELFDQAERQLAMQPLPALANNKVLLQKSTTKARAILTELQVMIDGLLEQSTIGRRYRRKIGSSKVVLRKSEIKALDEKLDEALTQFQMAQSLYMMATLMHNPILSIEGQSTNSNESGKNQTTSDSSIALLDSGDEIADDRLTRIASEPKGNVLVSARRTIVGRANVTLGSRDGFQFSLRTPDWLSPSVYSFMASKGISGWNFHLRAYEVVPSLCTTDLIHHFENDDAVAIFKFLDENKMTPFVRDMDGHGLLHLACEYSSINFMSLLLKRGTKLSVSQKDTPDVRSNSSTWLWFLLLKGFEAYSSLNRKSPFPAQKILQLLRSHDVDEKAFDNPGSFVKVVDLPPNIHSTLMGDEEYHCIPLTKRLEEARDAWPVVDFEPFLSWLPELKHDPCNLLQTSREPGASSFIHAIANHLPFATNRLSGKSYIPITTHPWFEPFCKCIASDPAGVSHVEDWPGGYGHDRCGGETPLSLIIHQAVWESLARITRAQRMQEVIQLWATALFSCGISLLNYGRNEKALCQSKAVLYRKRALYPCNSRSKRPSLRSTLIGITYGSQPEHWKLWWAIEYEDFAGDFWCMVEHPRTEDPKLIIPGSWMEESKNPGDVGNERLREWLCEESSPLIWTEYRKIRPPV